MNLLLICPSLNVGGAERHWSELAPRLGARGIGVHVLSLHEGGRMQEVLELRGVRVTNAAERSWTPAEAVARAARSHPSAVMTVGSTAHLAGRLVAGLAHAPWIVNWHRQPENPLAPLPRLALQVTAPTGHAIAVSRSQVPVLRSLCFRKERIHVISNGVDVRPLRSSSSVEQLRAELRSHRDGFLALQVCTLRPEKRSDVFIRAIAEASRKDPRVSGAIAGDGPCLEEWRALAESLRAPVRFLGYRHDVRDLMQAADVVCLTSDAEAAPLSILEAMERARPVIATRVGELAEMITDGVSGYVVNRGDWRTLAQRLAFLAERRETAAAMGVRARASAEDGHDVEQMSDRYAALLHQLARG